MHQACRTCGSDSEQHVAGRMGNGIVWTKRDCLCSDLWCQGCAAYLWEYGRDKMYSIRSIFGNGATFEGRKDISINLGTEITA